MALTKNRIREVIKQKLKGQDPEARSRKSKSIRTALYDLDSYKKSRCLLIYVSMDAEVDTREIIKESLKLGKRVVVPKVKSKQSGLEIREITSLRGQLALSPYGIPEPIEQKTRPADVRDVDCAVVPGLAFDPKGNRLGHGRAFFDRFLKTLKASVPRIGLAFDFQLLAAVPRESHDQRVHTVLTS